jgi:acetyltransferase-like isoleucine patch superfamily enzyme
MTQMQDNNQNSPAMSAQQRRFTKDVKNPFSTYRELIVGNKNWGWFSAFELYNLFCAPLPSFIGYGLRSFCLSPFLKNSGKNTIIGRGLTLRQPQYISIGKGTIIDDYVTLDVRADSDDSNIGIEIGNHVLIGRQSIIVAKNGSIVLGDACNISSCCRIATQSSVRIGESVLIAAFVYIGPGNHRMDSLEHPIIEQDMEVRGGVKIGANAWIGTRATILDGVTIGENAVIGAHSLVMNDVPDGAIVAGTPAKVIRYRDASRL